ncbi:hypothetical protein BDW22DRAFT_178790 [Trametopsis cervina]|nr:hypothetical protein BDW22DRAFT_178790 [Trametopsis cervina]
MMLSTTSSRSNRLWLHRRRIRRQSTGVMVPRVASEDLRQDAVFLLTVQCCKCRGLPSGVRDQSVLDLFRARNAACDSRSAAANQTQCPCFVLHTVHSFIDGDLGEKIIPLGYMYCSSVPAKISFVCCPFSCSSSSRHTVRYATSRRRWPAEL